MSHDEFEQVVGRKPDIAVMLRETTEQVFEIMRETKDPKDWTYPAIGTMVWDSIPEHWHGLLIGHLLDVYITEVYWAMRHRECRPMAGDRKSR